MNKIRQPIVTLCGHVDHGKCIAGDTLIPLVDGTLITAKELFEQNFDKTKSKKIDDGVLQDISSKKIKLFSFKKNKLKKKIISHVWKRKAGTLIEITTTAGDIIKTTPEHPYFTFSIDGPKEKQATELEKGEYIGIPKKINIENSNPKKEIIKTLPNLNNFVCFLNENFDIIFKQIKNQNLKQLERKSKITHLADGLRKKRLRIKDLFKLGKHLKIKEEKIGLNKILLAFSLLFGLGVSGIVIRNYNSYYINDVLLNNFFLYFTHIIIAVAVSSFLLIISSKSFQKIININVTRAVSIYTIVISILIFVVQIKSIQFIFIIISIILGYFYLIFFHLELINRSKGKIRKRIILIFIGEVLLISNILIGSEEIIVLISLQHMPFITLISNFVTLFALTTILLCVYKFPIFLEFNWDKNLIKLFIVNTQNFEIIYTFNFTEEIERKENTTKKPSEIIESDYFFSRGIIGIKDIISGITNKKEERIENIPIFGIRRILPGEEGIEERLEQIKTRLSQS